MEKPINYLDESNMEYAIDLGKYYAQALKNSLSDAKINIKQFMRELKEEMSKQKFLSFKEIAVIVALGVSLGCGAGIGHNILHNEAEVVEVNNDDTSDDSMEQTQPIKRINEDLIEIAKQIVALPPEEADLELYKLMMSKKDEFPDIFITYTFCLGKSYDGMESFVIDRGYKSVEDFMKKNQEKIDNNKLQEATKEYESAKENGNLANGL